MLWSLLRFVDQECQLLLPAPPYYPIPREKFILGVIYRVLLWADMNTAWQMLWSLLRFVDQECQSSANKDKATCQFFRQSCTFTCTQRSTAQQTQHSTAQFHHPTRFLVPNYFCFCLIFLKKLGTKKPLGEKIASRPDRVALGDEVVYSIAQHYFPA